MKEHFEHQLNKLAGEVAELEYVPGLTMPDPENSLQKLHKRMQRKKSSRKELFLLLAAACVTIMLTIPVLLVNRNSQTDHNAIVKQPEKKGINSPAIPEDHTVTRKENDPIVKLHSPQKTEAIIKAVEKNKFIVPGPANNPVDPVKPDSPALNPMIETAVAPMKRKYPVVHINSLKTTESTESVISDIKNPFRRIILRPGMPPSSVPVYSSEHVINQNKNPQN